MDGMREPRPSWVACMLREVAGDSSSLQTAWDVMHVDSVKPALLESRKETRAERKALASVKPEWQPRFGTLALSRAAALNPC